MVAHTHTGEDFCCYALNNTTDGFGYNNIKHYIMLKREETEKKIRNIYNKPRKDQFSRTSFYLSVKYFRVT